MYTYNIYTIYIVFTTEDVLEIAIESWSGWIRTHDH